MRNLAAVNLDESTIFFAHLSDHRLSCDQCDQWWVNILLSIFITFRTNIRMNIIPPHVRFYLLSIEWSLNAGIDKKPNAICIFANLCSTLVCSSNFLQLGSTLCQHA